MEMSFKCVLKSQMELTYSAGDREGNPAGNGARLTGATTMARLIFVAAVVLSTSASAAPWLTWPVSEASISCRMVRYAPQALFLRSARIHGVGARPQRSNHPTAEAVRIVSGGSRRFRSAAVVNGSGVGRSHPGRLWVLSGHAETMP